MHRIASDLEQRGRKLSQRRSLTTEQCQQIAAILRSSVRPITHHLPYETWSQAAITELVNKRFRVHLSRRAIALYEKRGNFVLRPVASQASSADTSA